MTSCVTSEKLRYKDTVGGDALAERSESRTRGPRELSITNNLDFVFVKDKLFTLMILDCKRHRVELS